MSEEFKDGYSGMFDDMKKNSHNNKELFELIKKRWMTCA